jgi:hypothetical protein
MPESKKDNSQQHVEPNAQSSSVGTKRAWHEEMATSKEVLAATLEGFEQIRRGEGVRITRKKK